MFYFDKQQKLYRGSGWMHLKLQWWNLLRAKLEIHFDTGRKLPLSSINKKINKKLNNSIYAFPVSK
jgi:hypothetical protein